MNKPTIEELEAQVKQLAAENAALKIAAIFLADEAAAIYKRWNLIQQPDGDIVDMQTIHELMCACHDTPATDAILASLRAEGVEMFVEDCKSRHGQHVHPFASVGYSAVVELGSQFASQLRSKSEVQS